MSPIAEARKMRKDIDSVIKVPNRFLDAGWSDYRLPSPRHMIYIWTTSMADEDLQRIMQIPRDNNWDQIAIPGVSGRDALTGRDTKHYIANTLPWFQFMQGHLPNYPEEILAANIEMIANQLRKMHSKTGDPRSWESYDPATADVEVGFDLRVDGNQIHAWQEFNPVYFEGLAQMTMGAPMHISHGGLQHGKVRLFDGLKQRPGLPEDVGAIVDNLSATSISMQVVNLSKDHNRQLVIQAGSFGEHRFVSVNVSTESGESQTHMIDGKWFAIDLAPGVGATLSFAVDRYVNTPTYETPWQNSSDWDPVITGRPAENFR